MYSIILLYYSNETTIPVIVKDFKSVDVQYPYDAIIPGSHHLHLQLCVDSPHNPRKKSLVDGLGECVSSVDCLVDGVHLFDGSQLIPHDSEAEGFGDGIRGGREERGNVGNHLGVADLKLVFFNLNKLEVALFLLFYFFGRGG